MGVHALKNASGSKRWINCPGSLRLSEGRHSESGEAAREGTAAHGLGEVCLKQGLDAADFLGGVIYLDQREDAIVIPPDPDIAEQAEADAWQTAGFGSYPIEANMVDAVQVYLDVCREEQQKYPGSEMVVERRFDLSWLRPDMFGTNDCSIFQAFEHLSVIDYKHGQGVVVEVRDEPSERVKQLLMEAGYPTDALRGNYQLLYYGLGIASEVGWAFETLDLIIVQPRAHHADGGVRRYSTTKAELKVFEAVLALAADDCDEPNAPLQAGSWCEFCPAAGVPCPALQDLAYKTAALDFVDGEPQVAVVDEGTPDEKLAEAMAAVGVLDIFIKAVKLEALRRLRESEDGTGFGHKLVRKKSNRAWRDGMTLVEELVRFGFPRESLFEQPKMKSPSKVEALRPPAFKDLGIRPKDIRALVADLAFKPEGGITVAPMSDPRDPVSPASAAAADFEEVEEE